MMMHWIQSESVLVLVEDGVAAVRGGRFTGSECASSLPLALLAAVGVVAFLLLRGEGEDPAALAIDRYVAAWTRGDDAARRGAHGQPEGGRRRRSRPAGAGLDGASVTARVLVSAARSAARVQVDVEGAGLRAVRLRRSG